MTLLMAFIRSSWVISSTLCSRTASCATSCAMLSQTFLMSAPEYRSVDFAISSSFILPETGSFVRYFLNISFLPL